MMNTIDATRLRIGRANDGRMLAIAYEVSGEDVIVLDVEVVKDETEASTWFEKVRVEKPWVNRS